MTKGKVITIVEGEIKPEQEEAFINSFNALNEIPKGLLKSYILQGKTDGLWQVLSMWESEEALAYMQKTTTTPAAIELFKNLGSKPTVRVVFVRGEKL